MTEGEESRSETRSVSNPPATIRDAHYLRKAAPMVRSGAHQRFVSPFLRHFVGKSLETDDEQYEVLVTILKDRWLVHPGQLANEEKNPGRKDNRTEGSGVVVTMGKGTLSKGDLYRHDIICFGDIPRPDLLSHCERYSYFGLALTKEFLISKGARPVMYVPSGALAHKKKNQTIEVAFDEFSERHERRKDSTMGPMMAQAAAASKIIAESESQIHPDGSKTLPPAVNELVANTLFPDPGGDPDKAFTKFREDIDVALYRHFLDLHIMGFVKFFDPALPDDHINNFYMEREWRVMGNVSFSLGDVREVYLPEEYISRLKEDTGYSGQAFDAAAPS